VDSDDEVTEVGAAILDAQNTKDVWNKILSYSPLTNEHKLSRPRVIRQSPEGKRKKGMCRSETTAKLLPERLKQFPNHSLCIQHNQLYCRACCTVVTNRSSTISNHVKGIMHAKKLVQYNNGVVTQKTLHAQIQTLEGMNENKEKEIRYRMEVCAMFLFEGISFNKLQHKTSGSLRDLLERDRTSIPHHEVRELIEKVHSNEISIIKKEIGEGIPIGVSFDGTTEVAEIMNVVIRFVTAKGCITQRLLALKILKKSPNANELSAFLIETLFTRFGFSSEHILSICRDGAAVNTAASKHLQPVLYKCVFPICISHSAAVAGNEINLTANVARLFISYWTMMVAKSGTARLKFQTYAGVKAKRLGKVRWFTFWEVGAQLHKYYNEAKQVINDADEFSEDCRSSLRIYVNGPEESILRMELALLKDCQCLVEFCYTQEGDGFLVVTTYNHLESVVNGLRTITHATNPISPEVSAIIESFNLPADQSRGMLLETTSKAKNTLKKLVNDMKPNERLGETIGVLRAARYWNYKWIATQPLVTIQEEIVHIHRIGGIDEDLRHDIENELEDYMRLAVLEINKIESEQCELWPFFVKHKLNLEATYRGACVVALITPSSATSERVFAMYDTLFGYHERSALEDMREASIMLRMNQNWRSKENEI
jgi:hypothetical protein